MAGVCKYMPISVLAFMLAAGTAAAQPGDCLDYRNYLHTVNEIWLSPDGDRGYDELVYLVIVGEYAYVAHGWSVDIPPEYHVGLTTLSLAEREQPVVVDAIDFDGIFSAGIAADGNRLYEAYVDFSGDLVEVFDLSTPHAPVSLGRSQLPYLPQDFTVVDEIGYFLFVNGLGIYDVSAPTAFTEVAFLPLSGNARRLHVGGGIASVATVHDGVKLVDVSDPMLPQLRGSALAAQDVRALYHEGDLLCTSTTTEDVYGRYGWFQALDIGDPDAPLLLDEISLSSEGAVEIKLHGGSAIVSCYDHTMLFVDLSAPAELTLQAWLRLPGESLGFDLLDTSLYYPSSTSIVSVADVSHLALPAPAGTLVIPGGAPRHLAAASDLLAYSRSGGGLQLIDISDPVAPAFRGALDLPASTGDLDIAGDHVLAVDSYLRVVDVTDPFQPELVGNWEEDYVNAVAATPGYAYVATNDALTVVSLADPTNPQSVGSKAIAGGARDVEAAGNLVFVLLQDELLIADVSNPGAPALLSALPVGSYNRDCVVRGDYVYIAGSEAWPASYLHVVDVSSPTWPFLRGSAALAPGLHSFDLAILENFAYVSNKNTVQVVEISVPANPVRVSSFQCSYISWGTPADLVVGNGYLFAAMSGDTDGLFIHPPHCDLTTSAPGEDGDAPAAAARLNAAWPNPFNPHTTLSFDLAKAGRVRLSVHDVAGREVALLAEAEITAGRHTYVWRGIDGRGRPVGSGVYFARLSMDGLIQSSKLVLLR